MRRYLFMLMTMTIAMASPALATNAPPANLTILTDPSLMLPLARLARDYATRTHTPVTVVVKSAADAQAQIEQGLEAHIVLSANTELLDRLTEQGVTDVSSRKPVARTNLALVATRDVKKSMNLAERISFAAMLNATGDAPIFVNTPETMEGARAHALLADPEFSKILSTRIITKSGDEDIAVSLRDEGGLALMLATHAITERDLVVLSVLPEDVSAPVTYDTVVLASELMDESNRFVNYLTGREAQKIFSHFGYQTAR